MRPLYIGMLLPLLFATAGSCAYYDAAADVLFLDLQGPLTLAMVRKASLELARLALQQRYRRVLISAQQVSGTRPEACQWLARVLAPGLRWLGVCQLAWVRPPSMAGMMLAALFVSNLPVVASVFVDVEHAATWLRSHPQALAGQRPQVWPGCTTRPTC